MREICASSSCGLQRGRERNAAGFSLLEIVIALAIIALLALAALPSGEGRMDQAYIVESMNLTTPYKMQVAQYQQATGEFPTDNNAMGLPMPDEIQGNYLASLTVEHGALHLQLGNKIRSQLQGKILTLRPIFVPGVQQGAISWVCGHDEIPGAMVAAGPNRTNVAADRLPVQCR